MRRFLLFLFISGLLFTSLVACKGVQAQNQDTYSLHLQGFVWERQTLNALLLTVENESWWNPNYVNITLRAIGQWNEALAAFSANYSDFSYLNNLRIRPTITNESKSGFDIYVNWIESPASSEANEVGLSRISSNGKSAIINCSLDLATHTKHGDDLNEGDLQNIALHELGHSLGLGHSNYTGDLMYSYYTMGDSAEFVSTLDVYGVATLFAWEINSMSFYPVNRWLKENPVILPAEIVYRDLPVSPQNARPQTLANSFIVQILIFMFEVLIHPEILALVLLITIMFVIVILVPTRKKPKDVKAQP